MWSDYTYSYKDCSRKMFEISVRSSPTSKSGGSPEGKMDGVRVETSSNGSIDQLDGTGATQVSVDGSYY